MKYQIFVLCILALLSAQNIFACSFCKNKPGTAVAPSANTSENFSGTSSSSSVKFIPAKPAIDLNGGIRLSSDNVQQPSPDIRRQPTSLRRSFTRQFGSVENPFQSDRGADMVVPAGELYDTSGGGSIGDGE